MTGVQTCALPIFVHVPFNGNGPAGVATIGGQVQALFGSMPAVLPQAKAGRLRPLAVGTPKRSPALPEVPAVAETFPGFDAQLWLGFFAPKGTPAPILKRLYAELASIARSPEMKEQFERNGADPQVSTSPAELTRLVVGDVEKYTKVIKAAGIQPQ